MKKEDFITYWLETSRHDLDVAQSLFDTKNFDYCLFLCHLSLEKLLKALWVKSHAENHPPKSHNLVYLAQQANLNLDDERIRFLQLVNTFNMGTRYPDYKLRIYKMCSQDFTEDNFAKVKELREWLIARL